MLFDLNGIYDLAPNPSTSLRFSLEEYIFPAERYEEILNNLNEFERKLSMSENQLEGLAKEYYEVTSKHTTSKENRTKRINIIRELIIPFLIAKDSRRSFNDEERRIIWNLSLDKKCALCGEKIEWENYNLDHITSHSKGGKTELKNSQITHKKCNVSKSNK
jgi:5-methylcytosine-specific restriction endonuclease McrA